MNEQEKQAQNEKRQATVEQIRHQVNRDLTGEAEAFKQAFPGYHLVWNITVEAVQEDIEDEFPGLIEFLNGSGSLPLPLIPEGQDIYWRGKRVSPEQMSKAINRAGRRASVSERLTQITIVEKEIHKLQPGEVTYANVTYNSSRKDWFIGCPSGKGCIGNLIGHSSTYDRVNLLLTFSPSILCSCGAHYFVERNQIRWV